MYIEDVFRLSLNGIFHRKLRSWLTILGIVVGVAAVIALVSIGQGLQQTVNSQLSQLGGNLIFITPGHERAGGGFGFGGAVSDNTVIMTEDASRTVVSGIASNDVSEILVKADDAYDPIAVASQIESELIAAHHVTVQTEDFTVNSAQTIQQNISNITGSITIFLGGIAAISLFVGGIGVANTMFTSVMERTRQIGVLKSLGMTSIEIMKLFLIESALMGLIGGAIGTLIGFIASGFISGIGVGSLSVAGAGRASRGVSTYVSPELVLFAVGFSVLIGIVSGLLPARSAAKLQPVEALRYE